MMRCRILASLVSLFMFCLAVTDSTAADIFRIAYGSCHDVLEVQVQEDGDIWDRIGERSPSAFIWGGDNAYADSGVADIPGLVKGTPEFLEEVYKRTKSIPQYINFVNQLGSENVVGTWDDHDFGLNNAGEEYEYREETQKLFLKFLDVPLDDPRYEREGVYSVKYFNEGTIKVIMLDIRYFRNDYSTEEGDFLGEAQWEFLKTELNENLGAEVKATVIVSGLQMIPDGYWCNRQRAFECWNKFPNARERLLNTISTSVAPNVMLLSGDVHYTEIAVAKCGSYHLPELTSSGMTHSTSTSTNAFFGSIYQSIGASEYRWEGKYSNDKNFGELDFSFGEIDAENYVILRSLSDAGELNFEKKILFSQLKPAQSQGVVDCTPP